MTSVHSIFLFGQHISVAQLTVGPDQIHRGVDSPAAPACCCNIRHPLRQNGPSSVQNRQQMMRIPLQTMMDFILTTPTDCVYC